MCSIPLPTNTARFLAFLYAFYRLSSVLLITIIQRRDTINTMANMDRQPTTTLKSTLYLDTSPPDGSQTLVFHGDGRYMVSKISVSGVLSITASRTSVIHCKVSVSTHDQYF